MIPNAGFCCSNSSSSRLGRVLRLLFAVESAVIREMVVWGECSVSEGGLSAVDAVRVRPVLGEDGGDILGVWETGGDA